MSRVFQRAGRSGWYLGVSVPKSIRKKLGRNEVHKKVGNTHKEALINKSRVEAEIQRYFGVELNQLSLVDEVTAMYESDPNYKGIKSIAEMPAEEKQLLKDIYQVDYDLPGNPTTPEEAALWKALDGQTTWQQWINRRVMTENISKATIRNWESRLKMVSAWKGSDYLTDLTKTDALNFKDYALRKGHIGSSVKNIIGCLSGFWNWGKDNQIIKENIWEGLKKRLPDPAPRKLPDRSILISATEKAATITPNRKEKDYAFLITRYTGCRNGAANGLRHCDIDLENKTISFVNWEVTNNQYLHWFRNVWWNFFSCIIYWSHCRCVVNKVCNNNRRNYSWISYRSRFNYLWYGCNFKYCCRHTNSGSFNHTRTYDEL